MGNSHKNLLLRNHWANCKIKFGCGGHLGLCSGLPDTILEEDHPRIISAKFGWDWLSSFRGEDFFLFHPLFSIFSVVTILVGSQDHRTQFLKGATQGSFHQSLVAIGPVVSEELCRNDPCVVPFQNCVRHFIPPTKMASTAELNLT
jgi:hypothetical protein